MMIRCSVHFSGDEFLPCAWPDCASGSEDAQIEREIYGKRTLVRASLDSYDGRVRYFWRNADGDWWTGLSALRACEVERIHQSLYLADRAYHYTGVSAFKSIIETQELWLSDYAYLNDASEIRHGLKLAEDMFTVECARMPTYVRGVLDRLLALPANEQPRICVACFSFERDSLTQWKAYGDANVGIAFGIEPARLFQDIESPADIRFAPVVYNNQTKQHLIRTLVHDFTALFERDDCDQMGGVPDEYDALLQSHFYETLSTFKDDAFRDERELRFIFQELPRLMDNSVFIRAKKRFRVTGPLIVPYTTTRDIANSYARRSGLRDHQIGLTDVVIGPHPQATLVAAGMREFLDAYGYANVPVEVSRVPFR